MRRQWKHVPRRTSPPDDARIVRRNDSPIQPVLRIRPAGRVVLLDPDDRVLLMRYDDGPPNGVHWSTPGGGLNPGEDFAAGAARELAEETGWDGIVLLGEIHRWTHTMEYDDAIVRQAEPSSSPGPTGLNGRSTGLRRCMSPTA
jgi:8-oxo-dGTP pyrophosphatase MutT (NUDIX family)